MDPLIALLSIVMAVLTILLVIVGIQVILILKEVKHTLQYANKSLQSADNLLHLISHSAVHLDTTFAGMKTGLKLVEAFVAWVKEHAGKHDSLYED